ncbi:unnamed protein product, partial [Adineta ricciae]
MSREINDEHERLLNKENLFDSNSSRLEWCEARWNRCFHLLFWWWINPILSIGSKQLLTLDDLDHLPFYDKSSHLLTRFQSYNWKNFSIIKILVKEFGREYFIAGLLHVPSLFLQISLPLLIRQIVHDVLNRDQSSFHIYFYAILLFICSFTSSICYRQADFHSLRIGMRIRHGFMSFIYKKSLEIKSITWQRMNLGYMINLIANDTQKLEDAFTYGHKIWEGLVGSLIIFIILSSIMEPIPILIGYSVIVLIVFIQLIIAYVLGKYRIKTSFYSDKRVNSLNEMISGCDVIKMNNWEELMEKQIIELREKELSYIRRSSYCRALSISLFCVSSSLLAFVTFSSAWLFDYSLNTIDTFIALAYFSFIRDTFMHYFSFTLEKIIEAKFAFNRISSFLRLIYEQDDKYFFTTVQSEEKGKITMKNASFSWDSNKICLFSLNVSIAEGSFVGIFGQVGSGKSSFLAAILGEMNLVEGEMNTNQSSFSYVSQSPWIFVDTLRNNILLNEIYDDQRYQEIIYACCLDVDFHLLGTRGDLTMIGEKGMNLSGGQKARVALARALYKKADIYLFDDPLAAVDRTVAKLIYERCFGSNGLLKTKTRLLVTHQLEFLQETNQIIYLFNGFQKEFNENFVNEDRNTQEEDSFIKTMLCKEIGSIDPSPIICDEKPTEIYSNWSLWNRLFTAPPCGLSGFCLFILLFLFSEILFDGTNYWIGQTLRQINREEIHPISFFYKYSILTISLLGTNLLSINLFFHIFLNGTHCFHNRMIKGLLCTSMEFYESNPIGRNLSRVSKDQQIIDEFLPRSFIFGLSTLSTLFGSFVMITLTNPYMIILFLILIPIFIYFAHLFRITNRQLKQLESLTRAPFYSLYSSSLNGLIPIRVFQVEEHFVRLFTQFLDVNIKTQLNIESAGQWCYLRLEFLASLILFGTALFIIYFHKQFESSMITFTLVYAMIAAYRPQRSIRRLVETDLFQTSAERIDEYGQLLNEEDYGGKQQLVQTLFTWPEQGKIQFDRFSFRYRSSVEPVLKNIHVEINPREKIGIIGRTGAGKSSLFKSLFRFPNRSYIEGEIRIDDVDISRITLDQLRSNLSIIPQQSILFSGTLRYNLDPFNQHSDEECWTVLEDVQLKEFVKKYSAGLQMMINERGENLSFGQCQLICIARAILRKTKILLIDEGTANVDYETDQIIQNVIATKFSDRTVLIIAHRL